MSARNNFFSGLVVLFVTAVFFMAAFDIEEDPFGTGMEPYTFPLTVSAVLAALTLVFVVKSALEMRREARKPSEAMTLYCFGGKIGVLPKEVYLFFVWVLPMAGIAFVYLGLMNLFQYLVPTILCMSASLAIFGNRGVKWLVTIPIVAGLIYYTVFFGVFRLLEPRGLLWEYDNFYVFGAMRRFLGV